MPVIIEHYKTLEALVDTIESRPTNTVFQGATLASQQTEKIRKGATWYGTQNYQEAADLLKNGYKEPLQAMKAEIVKINKTSGPIERPRRYESVVGYRAHVPNAIKGIPTSMYNKEPRQIKAKTIHLIYGFSAVGNVTAPELIKGGTKFIGLVNSLEKSGYRVKVDILRATTASTSDAIIYTVNLKEYSQNLNLLKLCFPLVHPSMLRRISFRWCETLPNLTTRDYRSGYGQSLIVRMDMDSERERAFLERHNILTNENMYYCNVYDAMKANNIDELAKKIGLK